MRLHSSSFPCFRYLLVCFLVLFSQACTISLVSEYDQKTDEAVTAFHKNLERFFIELENQAGSDTCALKHHESFYNEAMVELRALQLRTQSIPNNSLTSEQVELLNASVATLKATHEAGCLSSGAINLLRRQFETQISAILRLEFAKKRGQDTK